MKLMLTTDDDLIINAWEINNTTDGPNYDDLNNFYLGDMTEGDCEISDAVLRECKVAIEHGLDET